MMKLTNSFHSISPDKPRWEKTSDGFLRCKARVLAERVMPYARQELSGIPDEIPGTIIQMLVSRDTMASAESLRSLEGAAVVSGEHNWLDPSTIKTFQIGQVAGSPIMDGPYLVCDLLITCPLAIESIEAGTLGEISAAYTADTIFEQGDFDGVPFDARQTQLRYNHIAVLPVGAGRAGTDVRIINHKQKEIDMPEDKKIIRVQLKNGRYLNTDEEGAAAVAEDQKVANDERATSGKKLEELMAEAQEAKAGAEAANAELEELKGELSVYKEKLDALLSTEAIEHAAMGMVAESAEAEEIIENAAICNEKGEEDEKEKEKVMNSLKGLHGTKLHSAVLTAVGVKVENMSAEGIRGAFKAQHQITNSMKGRKTVAGVKMMNHGVQDIVNNHPVERTSRERLGFAKK